MFTSLIVHAVSLQTNFSMVHLVSFAAFIDIYPVFLIRHSWYVHHSHLSCTLSADDHQSAIRFAALTHIE